MARSKIATHREPATTTKQEAHAPPRLAGYQHAPTAGDHDTPRTLTPWQTAGEAADALGELATDCPGVDVEAAAAALEAMPATARVAVGWAPTPVLYVWTRAPSRLRRLTKAAAGDWSVAVEAVEAAAPAAGGTAIESASVTARMRRLLPGLGRDYELCRVAWSSVTA